MLEILSINNNDNASKDLFDCKISKTRIYVAADADTHFKNK